MREQLDSYLLEPARLQHLLPRLRRGRLLPAPGDDPHPVPEDANNPRRPTPEHRLDLLPHEAPVARVEGQREHHVADHEPPSRLENPPGLGERKLLARIVEMVEGVVRDHKGRGLVLERQPPEIGDERLHVVHAVGSSRVVEALQHPLRDVHRHQLLHVWRERKREETCARAEIDDQVVGAGIGELDDPIADREEGAACGYLLPRLDALVPAVRIRTHGPHGYRSG